MSRLKFMNKIFLYSLWVTILIFIGCGRNYTPKPYGYFRIDFPEKEYTNYVNNYPYKFEYPVYTIIKDYNKDSAWINLVYPENNAIIHITYKEINNNLSIYLEETRNLVYKHTLKADAISETPYLNYNTKVYGILYDIKGNAASSINFFVTDSTKHFLRGALYFHTQPNKDSLSPVIEFIRHDIVHLMETIEWK